MRIFTFIITVLFCCTVSATEDQITFASDVQKTIYLETVVELRCPKCQNQNIADSNAVVAKDMRVKVKALLDEGKSKQQVIDYMVNRYGQFVHYQPPLNIATSLLWLLPIGFILFAVFMQVKRSRNSGAEANITSTNNVEAKNKNTDNTEAQTDLDKELALLLTAEDEELKGNSPNDNPPLVKRGSIENSKDNK